MFSSVGSSESSAVPRTVSDGNALTLPSAASGGVGGDWIWPWSCATRPAYALPSSLSAVSSRGFMVRYLSYCAIDSS